MFDKAENRKRRPGAISPRTSRRAAALIIPLLLLPAAISLADHAASPGPAAVQETVEAAPRQEGRLVDFTAATERGLFWMYLAAFLGGILASLTPCVLPIIPLTITVIGARAAKSRAKGFSLSLIYVLGIAITYSVLGVVAASTGALFGSLFQSNLFLIFAIALFALLAFGLFGAYELQLPAGIRNRLMARQGEGWFGILFMGLIAGLVASPCVGPIIVGILAFIAQTGNIIFGFTLLFTFSLGMGILFMVVGTFSGEIKRMPSGMWMTAIEYFLGVLLLAVAFYYLSILLDPFPFVLILGAALVTGGAFAGAFTRLTGEETGWFPRARKAFGVLLLASGLYFFVGGLMTYGLLLPPVGGVGTGGVPGEGPGAGRSSEEAGAVWGEDLEGALLIADIEQKPVIIDFTADWCVACRELDNQTFSDPRVIETFRNFVLVRIDMTDNSDPGNREYTERYEIYGLPSVTFLTPSGEMLRDLKVTGFVNADRFLEVLGRVLEASKNH